MNDVVVAIDQDGALGGWGQGCADEEQSENSKENGFHDTTPFREYSTPVPAKTDSPIADSRSLDFVALVVISSAGYRFDGVGPIEDRRSWHTDFWTPGGPK